MENGFKIQKPRNHFLQKIVDYYFFIDIPVSELIMKKEYVLPFPRITFGYFFEHPFLVTNHSKQITDTANMVISKISTDKISVTPLTERVKILGAHVKPFALAYLTNENISELPWLINTQDLFKKRANSFQKKVNGCTNTEQMFNEVESVFKSSVLAKDLFKIEAAIKIIETEKGNITILNIANKLEISSRTLRNYFYKHIGCSPKEYIQLVKLKQSIFQMQNESGSLTSLSYDQNFADQAHFTNTVKNITGINPKDIRKNLSKFRFLQF